MQTKSEIDKKSGVTKSLEKYPDDLIQEVKESIEDYKNGKYMKGDVKEIMKAIRDYDKNKTDPD